MPRTSIDWQSIAGAMQAPENDTRQWVSIGIVQADDAGQVVQFREDLGQPLVSVTLQPTLARVYCRVSSQVAGNGEGEWHPFVQGDEVVVVVPQGYEDAGCVIIGRLNNTFDKFPMDSVAGQDPTTNTFGFRRRRTPYVEESAGPVILRSALSSALITIDEVGNITLKDSQNAAMQMSADVIGFAGPSTPDTPPKYLLQLDLTHGHLNVQIDDAVLTLSSSSAAPEINLLSVPGPLAIGTLGNAMNEHVATTESVAHVLEILIAELISVINLGGPGLLTGVSLAAILSAWFFTPAFGSLWTSAATTPLGSVSLGLGETIAAALLTQPQKLTGAPPVGIGCLGLVVG